MVQMDEYINLPAQRLAHLVRKYVHHCRMKEIEGTLFSLNIQARSNRVNTDQPSIADV